MMQCAYSQSSMHFSKSFCPEGIATNAGNILLTDSGYIVTGAYKDSIQLRQRLYLMSINKTGGMNDVSTFGFDTIKMYPGSSGTIIRVNDSDLFWVCGKSNVFRDYATLFKLNKYLNIEWEKDYLYNNDTTYSFFALTNVISTHDYGFVMVGSITSSQNVSDLLIQKTDSLGNVQWRKSFVYKGLSYASSVIQTPDHGFLLGGGAYQPYVNQSLHGIIIKTDSLGNEQWRKYIGNPGYNNSYCKVLNSPDSNYIVVNAVGSENYTPIAAYKRLQITKVNPAGQYVWSKTIGNKMIESLVNQAIILPDGNIIACGDFYPGDTTLPVDSWSWILKTNHNGDSIWLREHYRYNGYLNTNRLQDLKPTPDGGYILVGTTDSFMYIPQSAWVLKVDSLGCAVPGCHLVGLKEVIMPPEEILLYPNPATTSITLRLPNNLIQEQKEVRVFNHAGQEVLRQPLPTGEPEPTLDIFHLPAGLYYLRVIHRDISTVLGKFVKN
jgi:hypothetical protein